MYLLFLLLGIILSLAGLFLTIYFFVIIDDLDNDLRNIADACSILNFIVPIEVAIQFGLCLVFIWQPYLYSLNLAMLLFYGYQIARRGGRLTRQLYDPKRIERRSDWNMQMTKGVFFLASVLLYVALIFIECLL